MGNTDDLEDLTLNMSNNLTTSMPDFDMQLPMLSPTVYRVMGIILVCFGVLGLFANGLIIVLIRLNRSLRGPFHQLLEALSWTQCFICVSGNPLWATSAFSHRWRFGQAGCNYDGFMMTTLGLFVINILTLISFERYICITWPQKNHLVNTRSVNGGLAVAFLIALVWGICPLVGWSQYSANGPGVGCCPTLTPNSETFTTAMLVMECFLPLTIILFFNISIFRVVRKSRLAMNQHVSEGSRKDNLRRERKVAFTLALAVGAFVVSWAPYAVTSLIYVINPSLVPHQSNLASALIAKFFTIWNPIIYTSTHPLYKKAFLKLFHCYSPGMAGTSAFSDSEQSATITKKSHVVTSVAPANGEKY